ncbi:MAG: TolC family protein [Planctomycetes bacterium]|nr:TolC family protein [Planctomycetota bacterium]
MNKRDGGRRAPYDPADGLSLEEAEAVALFFNASLRTLRLDSGVALAGAIEAANWQDPELSVDGGVILASIAQPWYAAAAIRFTIPLSGRPGVEQDKAYAVHREEWASVVAAEWELLGALRREWVKLAAIRQRLALAEVQLGEVESIRDSAKALLDVGRVTAAEVRVFEIELVRQELLIERLKRQAAIQVDVIRGILGLVPEAPVKLVTQLDAFLNVPPDVIGAMRERNPHLAVKRAAYDVAEQSLRLEIRKQYPDLTIGPGYEIEEGQSRIGIGFGLPIPIINLNRRGIAEARAKRLASKSAFEAEYERLAAKVAVSEKELQLATEIRKTLEDVLLPLASTQVKEVVKLGELGRLDVVLVLESMRTRYEAQLELVDARLQESLATISLAEVVGPTYGKPPIPTEGS